MCHNYCKNIYIRYDYHVSSFNNYRIFRIVMWNALEHVCIAYNLTAIHDLNRINFRQCTLLLINRIINKTSQIIEVINMHETWFMHILCNPSINRARDIESARRFVRDSSCVILIRVSVEITWHRNGVMTHRERDITHTPTHDPQRWACLRDV